MPDLFRRGNAVQAVMNIRTTLQPGPPPHNVVDIQSYMVGQVEWVVAGTGGISVSTVPVAGGVTWRLPDGTVMPAGLTIVNNPLGSNHWLIEPTVNMTLAQFAALVRGLPWVQP